MRYELLAIERQNTENKINILEKTLHDMESDWAECIRTGKSPCFFCVHDDTCDGRDCNFKWQRHN